MSFKINNVGVGHQEERRAETSVRNTAASYHQNAEEQAQQSEEDGGGAEPTTKKTTRSTCTGRRSQQIRYAEPLTTRSWTRWQHAQQRRGSKMHRVFAQIQKLPSWGLLGTAHRETWNQGIDRAEVVQQMRLRGWLGGNTPEMR